MVMVSIEQLARTLWPMMVPPFGLSCVLLRLSEVKQANLLMYVASSAAFSSSRSCPEKSQLANRVPGVDPRVEFLGRENLGRISVCRSSCSACYPVLRMLFKSSKFGRTSRFRLLILRRAMRKDFRNTNTILGIPKRSGVITQICSGFREPSRILREPLRIRSRDRLQHDP